jgi:transposase
VAGDKKSARRRRAWIVFQDESAVSLVPSVRATWAPKGKTPVLRHKFRKQRLSMSAAVCYAPDKERTRLLFEFLEGSYNDCSLIEFLHALHEQLGEGEKVTLIWDGLPSHRSKFMKSWIRTQRHWLVVEQLPGYAHDLNPTEQVWANAKGTDLANLCANDLDEVAEAASSALSRIDTDEQLCFSFLEHCGLRL